MVLVLTLLICPFYFDDWEESSTDSRSTGPRLKDAPQCWSIFNQRDPNLADWKANTEILESPSPQKPSKQRALRLNMPIYFLKEKETLSLTSSWRRSDFQLLRPRCHGQRRNLDCRIAATCLAVLFDSLEDLPSILLVLKHKHVQCNAQVCYTACIKIKGRSVRDISVHRVILYMVNTPSKVSTEKV